MKQFMSIIAAVALSFAVAACGDGVLTSPSTADLVNPDHHYEIDTWGANSEVYEITPKSNPNKSCIIFLTDSLESAAMQCYDKPVKK